MSSTTLHAEPPASGADHKQGLRFAFGFFAIAGLLFAAYAFPYKENGISEAAFERYLELYTQAAGAVLRIIEPHVVVQGTEIVGRFPLRIVKNCDAIEINILFMAATLAFPAPWKRRLVGVLVGLPVLVMLNILRICTLYFIGIHAPSSFETFHLEIWPLLMVGATTLVFLVYVHWAQRRSAAH